jgi:Sulfatase
MASHDSLQRSVLPIPDRKPVGLTTYDAKDPDTKFPPITPLRPPTGAPNVLVILRDDVGFGASSAFGGPCQTPNAEKLASNGLKYNRFNGKISWVQIDVEAAAKDADHKIGAEERFMVAMARQ